jgi:hypothetical protein
MQLEAGGIRRAIAYLSRPSGVKGLLLCVLVVVGVWVRGSPGGYG